MTLKEQILNIYIPHRLRNKRNKASYRLNRGQEKRKKAEKMHGKWKTTEGGGKSKFKCIRYQSKYKRKLTY